MGVNDHHLPSATAADEHGKAGTGGDLEPRTLLAAYRGGLFPMRDGAGELAWWSPDPRGVLTVDSLCVSRSLRRSLRRFDVTTDLCFEDVVDACADRAADQYAWITEEVRRAYVELHRLGWAHSIEAWLPEVDEQPRRLVGGLYGVAIGGFFSGESMFHRVPDASKAALVSLVDVLRADVAGGAGRMIDVQWLTPHLASLGAFAVPRNEYLERLGLALALPPPAAFTVGPG
jgi:leucyl/phenylalanyl-tRNA--protein transferase